MSFKVHIRIHTDEMVRWSWRNKHSCCWIIYSDSWFTTERLVVCYDPPATTSCKDTKRRQATGNVSRWATANLRSLIICRYSCKQQRPASEIRHRFLLLTMCVGRITEFTVVPPLSKNPFITDVFTLLRTSD